MTDNTAPAADNGPEEAPALIPAATVVVLRDGPDGLETLLLRRNASLVFAGGMWVFPGGRIDPDDHLDATAPERATGGAPSSGRTSPDGATPDGPTFAGSTLPDSARVGSAGVDETATDPTTATAAMADAVADAVVAADTTLGGVAAPDEHGDDPDPATTAAARRAAVREATEEADLALDPTTLVWFAHWTPPPITIKRYATWFFAAPAPADRSEVTIDGGEILDHVWVRPDDALARRNALEIELAPPTWITLEHLARHRDTTSALAAMRAAPPEYFATRFAPVGDGAVAVYDGDVAYDDLDPDPDRPGGRHRLWMLGDGWRYERSDWG